MVGCKTKIQHQRTADIFFVNVFLVNAEVNELHSVFVKKRKKEYHE